MNINDFILENNLRRLNFNEQITIRHYYRTQDNRIIPVTTDNFDRYVVGCTAGEYINMEFYKERSVWVDGKPFKPMNFICDIKWSDGTVVKNVQMSKSEYELCSMNDNNPSAQIIRHYMPTEHDLKTWPVYFSAVDSGKKTFEVRRNDRDFRVNDILNLLEWNPETRKYTGRKLSVFVTFRLDNIVGLDSNYVVLGINRIEELNEQ